MVNTQVRALLRLFKGYLQENGEEVQTEKLEKEILEKGLQKGLLYTDTLHPIPDNVWNISDELYGKKPEDWTATFHKSFSTVRDTPIEVLIAQQIVHYFTTYGLESLGLYKEDLVYIPKEKLEIPDLESDIPLAVIRPYNKEEIQEKMLTLLTSGIALAKETLTDLMELSDFLEQEQYESVTNKEYKAFLYKKYNIVPKNNIDFLRYMVMELTGTTLLIQNDDLINKLSASDTDKIYDLLSSYSRQYGLENLSQIFLRFKKLFLALKRKKAHTLTEKSINSIINKLAKLAKTNHKPLKVNILDRLIELDTPVEVEKNKQQIIESLDKVTIFREIRIVNMLLYRSQNPDSTLYRIRNGKAYIKENPVDYPSEFESLHMLVYTHLVNRLKSKLEGKTVYCPDNISYTVPTSEKQFTENIPKGSYIEVPRTKGMIIGVHWTNTDNSDSGRVDLDLHLQNSKEQYGWNTSYRSINSTVLFSGDMTDAPKPNGASEVYYIGEDVEDKSFILTLNNYSSPSETIPFEIIIGEADKEEIDNHYTVNPNKVKVTIPQCFEYNDEQCSFRERQKSLGYVSVTSAYIRFYFDDFSLGNSIVTRQTGLVQRAYDCLKMSTETQLKLNNLLSDCGVKFSKGPVVNTESKYFEKLENDKLEEITELRAQELKSTGNGHLVFTQTEQKPVDINLSLNDIDKTTLIKIFE